jgi:hypothetical protein
VVIGSRSLRGQGTIIAVNELEEGTGLNLDFGKLASGCARSTTRGENPVRAGVDSGGRRSSG